MNQSVCGFVVMLALGLQFSGLFPLVTSRSLADEPSRLSPDEATGARLEVRFAGGVLQVIWPAALLGENETLVRPVYDIEESSNLRDWTKVGGSLDDPAEVDQVIRRLAVPTRGDQAFFRVVARWHRPLPPLARSSLGGGGEEVFGYGAAFDAALQSIGQITPDEFGKLNPPPDDYVHQISFDPSSARFWTEFNSAPTKRFPPPFGGSVPELLGALVPDLRPNAREIEVLRRNGFVVSERLGVHSFAEQFYRLWINDLPVFISTDAILQAWHRSYVMMLEEIESTYMFENVRRMLTEMAAKVAAASLLAGDGPLRESVRDADFFITVARSLLEGETVPSTLGDDGDVTHALQAIKSGHFDSCFPLFGRKRGVDFSQFTVRGHYENSIRLGRYFQCVMWLGRTDLRVGGASMPDTDCDVQPRKNLRALGTSVVLTWLLTESGQFQRWRDMDQVINAFVGWTDSMTFAQMRDLLASAGIESLSDANNRTVLLALQDSLERGDYGIQNIRSDYFIAPLGGGRGALPRSFTVLGQKFIPDSWVLSQVVFDSVLWAENGATNKVMRRVPSGLDIAYAVFGNDHVVPDLVQRLTDTSDDRNPQRDGLPYQHNLAAARRVLDGQPWQTWQNNIYMDWLAALRSLSPPLTRDLRYPDVFRTHAWAMKTLNAQLASWTHLRHDTVLYAKQSYTPGAICFYPEGYVEPVPDFWRRLRAMAERTSRLIQGLPFEGPTTVFVAQPWSMWEVAMPVGLEDVKRAQSEFLNQFALIAGRLEKISLAQLAHQNLSGEDRRFIETLIEYHDPGGYKAGDRKFNGWYPSLFYQPLANRFSSQRDFFHQDLGADRLDALVTDVHTDLPCELCRPSDPGSVLHEGVGLVNLLYVIVQRGDESMMLAGPVLSHFEFEVVGPPVRLTDSQWRGEFGSWNDGRLPPNLTTRPPMRNIGWFQRPPNPPWTASYLVPIQ